MSVQKFKLTTVAAIVFAATNANAALYRVVEVNASLPSDAGDYYGSAISGTDYETTCFNSASTCDSNQGSSYNLAGDTLNYGSSSSSSSKYTYRAIEGISHKEEVPFGVDNHFHYLNRDELETYCNSYLKYSTCDSWADTHWYGDTDTNIGGLQNERDAYDEVSYQTNAYAFSEAMSNFPLTPSSGTSAPSSGISSIISNTSEQVVTRIADVDNDGVKDEVIGITSSGYYTNSSSKYVQLYRQRGFFTDGSSTIYLEPEYDSSLVTDSKIQNLVQQMGRTMAFDSFTYNNGTTDVNYIVGSASVAPFDYSDSDKDYAGDVGNCIGYDDPALYEECQNFAFASRAFLWQADDATNTRFSVASWSSASLANDGEAASQASVRAAVVPPAGKNSSDYDELPVLVGFNTLEDGDDLLMQAAVFRPTSTTGFTVAENAWTSTYISNATVEISGDTTYARSVATDINDNLLVIGEAKSAVNDNGAMANKLFIADATASTPTASYFNAMSEEIFFSGAGGKANSINNYNEIVGSVDAETHREVSGKARAIRGFIFPYDGRNSDTTRRAIFSNQAWWLDDLTNGGTYSSSNNKYRVIDATGINDAGVISATALKCASGYDSTAHFSYCGGGSEQERIVAVKLVPIAGASASDISERSSATDTKVSRSGGGLGWLSLGLLGLLGFRRRK